jgi:hypothetical protein
MLYDMGTGGEALHNPQLDMTTTNLINCIHSHADWIWNELHKCTTHSVDTYKWVAQDLEDGETAADNGEFKKAAGCLIGAARQVFGVYSDEYTRFVDFYNHAFIA